MKMIMQFIIIASDVSSFTERKIRCGLTIDWYNNMKLHQWHRNRGFRRFNELGPPDEPDILSDCSSLMCPHVPFPQIDIIGG